MSDQVVNVTIGTKADTAPLQNYRVSVGQLEASLKSLLSNANVANFGAAFSAGSLSFSSLISKVSDAVSGSSELASEMALVERRVGLAGEQFQVLARAGKVSSEELIAGISKYRVKLGEALSGDKSARAFFANLGLSPEAQTKLPMEAQLESLGTAIGRFKDKNEQAFQAQQAFGKGYTAMLPVLEALRTQGYDALADKVEHTSGILTNQMSSALRVAKKQASEAANELSIALAKTELRIQQVKATLAKFLAENAGTIQSAGSAIATGALAAGGLSTLVKAAGPQLTVFGSQVSSAFSRGLGTGLSMLPSLISERFGTGGGLATTFATLGRSLATPFGAAFVLAVGGFVINELERSALAAIEARDRNAEVGFARLRSGNQKIVNASTQAEADAALKQANDTLKSSRDELAALEKKIQDAEAQRAVALKQVGLPPEDAKVELTNDQKQELSNARELVELSEQQVKAANAQLAAIVAKNREARESKDREFVEAAELEKARAATAGLQQKEADYAYAALTTDKEKLDYLLRERATVEAAHSEQILDAENLELRRHRELEQRVALLDVDAKIAELRAKITKEQADGIAKAEQEIARVMEATQRAQEKIAADNQKATLRQVQADRAALEANFTKTSLEKQPERIRLLQREIEAHDRLIEQYKQMQVGATEAQQIDLQGKIESEEDRKQGAAGEITQITGGPRADSVVDQVNASITRFRDGLGTSAQSVGALVTGTLNSSLQGTSDLIYNLITHAESFSAAWHNAILSVGQSFARMAADMVAKIIWESTIERGLIRIGVLERVAGEGVKTSATLSGAATRIGAIVKEALASVYHGAVEAFKAMAAIPYVGPVLGAAAMAAALAGGIALVSKIGHADGGLITGPGGPRDDSIPAFLSNGEYVIPASRVSQYGVGFFDSIRTGSLGGSLAPVPKSVAASSGGGGGGMLQPILVASRFEAESIRRNSQVETVIMDVVRDNKWSIFGRKLT